MFFVNFVSVHPEFDFECSMLQIKTNEKEVVNLLFKTGHDFASW